MHVRFTDVLKLLFVTWPPAVFRVFQVRAEITSKEKEEEDMMEKVQKEAK